MTKSRRDRLAALSSIGAKAQENVESIRQNEAYRSPTKILPVAQIVPSPFQARRDFSQLDGLAQDIARHGVLQPVLVRPLANDRYELVAGERRWRAAQQAGKTIIPAVVRPMSDMEARIYGLTENLQREDLNAYEIAQAVVDLVATKTGLDFVAARQQVGSKQPSEAVALALSEALSLVGKEISPRSFARHYVPLLSLPEQLIRAIEAGGAYTAVLALKKATAEQQAAWLPNVIHGLWGVRDVESALKESKEDQALKAARPTETTESDWHQQWHDLTRRFDPQHLEQLDGRKQRKVRRLMQELSDLLG